MRQPLVWLVLVLGCSGSTRPTATEAIANAPDKTEPSEPAATPRRPVFPLDAAVERIQVQLQMTWRPQQVWSVLPGATRAQLGNGLRTVVLDVTIDSNGDLRKYTLKSGSGVTDLDVSALSTIQRVLPLPSTGDDYVVSLQFEYEPATGRSSVTAL